MEKTNSIIDKECVEIWSEIEGYYDEVGLPNIASSPEASKYLRMSYEEIDKLSPQECGGAAYMIGQESIYIQKRINKNKCFIEWANLRIDSLIKDPCDKGKEYTKFDRRRKEAIDENDVAPILHEKVLKCQRQIDALEYFPKHLDNMSHILNNNQKINHRNI